MTLARLSRMGIPPEMENYPEEMSKLIELSTKARHSEHNSIAIRQEMHSIIKETLGEEFFQKWSSSWKRDTSIDTIEENSEKTKVISENTNRETIDKIIHKVYENHELTDVLLTNLIKYYNKITLIASLSVAIVIYSIISTVLRWIVRNFDVYWVLPQDLSGIEFWVGVFCFVFGIILLGGKSVKFEKEITHYKQDKEVMLSEIRYLRDLSEKQEKSK